MVESNSILVAVLLLAFLAPGCVTQTSLTGVSVHGRFVALPHHESWSDVRTAGSRSFVVGSDGSPIVVMNLTFTFDLHRLSPVKIFWLASGSILELSDNHDWVGILDTDREGVLYAGAGPLTTQYPQVGSSDARSVSIERTLADRSSGELVVIWAGQPSGIALNLSWSEGTRVAPRPPTDAALFTQRDFQGGARFGQPGTTSHVGDKASLPTGEQLGIVVTSSGYRGRGNFQISFDEGPHAITMEDAPNGPEIRAAIFAGRNGHMSFDYVGASNTQTLMVLSAAWPRTDSFWQPVGENATYTPPMN